MAPLQPEEPALSSCCLQLEWENLQNWNFGKLENWGIFSHEIKLFYVFERPNRIPNTMSPTSAPHLDSVDKLVWHVNWSWCQHHCLMLPWLWKCHCCMDHCDGIRDASQLFQSENVSRTYQTFSNHDCQWLNADMAAVKPAKHIFFHPFVNFAF